METTRKNQKQDRQRNDRHKDKERKMVVGGKSNLKRKDGEGMAELSLSSSSSASTAEKSSENLFLRIVLLTCILITHLVFSMYLFRLFRYSPSYTNMTNSSQQLKISCQSCHPTLPNVLNVHIICHTHLDTGWVATYDEYYNIYVKQIYSSVLESLLKDEKRRFIAVEASYFIRWFMQQNSSVQQQVRQLVLTGRLELIGGGWSMNDEAAAHYSSIIDNLSYGHKKLEEIFGSCGKPKTGWQIDPFGHSREQASIFAQMGFDSLFLGRVDYQDIEQRGKTKTLEFVWESSPNIGKKSHIFTSILPNIYWFPKGFCYDTFCNDETLNAQNVKNISLKFIEFVKNQSLYYETNNTLVTMGMDFFYQDAEKWYRNLDYLIRSINSMKDSGVHLIYSTPSCYAKALYEENRKWTTKSDDFFPYADKFNAYWTGYFTTRPSLKYAIKIGQNVLHVANQLNVLALKGYKHAERFEELKEVMGILQHHDAVTGTSRQYVAEDFLGMLSNARQKAYDTIVSAFITLTKLEIESEKSDIGFCDEMNSSVCPFTESIDENTSIVMSIYNSLAHPLSHFVRVPVVNNSFYRVMDHNQKIIPSQLIQIFEQVETLPEREYSFATHELVFFTTLDPLGISSYLISVAKAKDYGASTETQVNRLRKDVLIHNGLIGILMDGSSGLIKEIQLESGEAIPFQQAFWYYEATPDHGNETASGAYKFNPTTDTPYILNENVTFEVHRGELVDEVHQVFTPWCGQVIRLYKNYSYIEFDWVVGPIPMEFPEGPGLEIITRYETDFQSNQIFFTDSNGREAIKRIRDFRPTWKLNTTEKVASNYYPVTSWIYIKDNQKDLQMTVLTDRSEGGSSMVDGTIELMLHRRLCHDDYGGVNEPLIEPGVDGAGLKVRGKHRLIIGRIKESVHFMRKLSKTTSWFPFNMFQNVSKMDEIELVSNLYSIGIREKLPENIHLLSMEQWNNHHILIRLEHIYEIDEDDENYSRNTAVELANLFTNFIIEDVKEMNLRGTDEIQKSEQSKMKFRTFFDPYESYTRVSSLQSTIESDGTYRIYLKPMEIRTFLIRVKPRFNI